MLKYIKANSKEQLEDEILFLKDHYKANVIEKPHTTNGKDWWTTVLIPR